MDERELEEIRRRKLMELQKLREEELQREQMKQQIEMQIPLFVGDGIQ